MTIQEILTKAGYESGYDNRNRAVKQINNLLSNNIIKINLVKKDFVRTTKSGFKYNIQISGFNGLGSQSKFSKGRKITPLDILTRIGKFLSREDVRKIVKADIKLPCECGKCNATGYLPQFAWYAEGVCFDCLGSGFTSFETSVEINKKLTPAQLIKKYSIDSDQVKFQGLEKVNCLKNEGHKSAEHWLFQRGKSFYIGQPKCQNKTSFKVLKTEFSEFAKNYNKSHFKNYMGTLITEEA